MKRAHQTHQLEKMIQIITVIFISNVKRTHTTIFKVEDLRLVVAVCRKQLMSLS